MDQYQELFCRREEEITRHIRMEQKMICSTCGQERQYGRRHAQDPSGQALRAAKRPRRGRPAALTGVQVEEVVRLKASGLKDKELALRFGVSKSTIYKVGRK
jgi:transposase